MFKTYHIVRLFWKLPHIYPHHCTSVGPTVVGPTPKVQIPGNQEGREGNADHNRTYDLLMGDRPIMPRTQHVLDLGKWQS